MGKDLDIFTKGDMQINKCTKRGYTSIMIRQMEIKNTMTYLYTPIKIAEIFKRPDNFKSRRKDKATKNYIHVLLVEM